MNKIMLTGYVVVLLGGVVLQASANPKQASNPMIAFQSQSFPAPSTSTPSPTESQTLQLIDTSSPVSTAGWTNYSGSTYAISVDYPPTVKPMRGGNDLHYPLAKIPLCNTEYFQKKYSNPSDCLYLPTDTYPETTDTGFIGASVAISVFNLDRQNCMNFKDIQVDGVRYLTIHGIIYSAVDTAVNTYNSGLAYSRKDVHYRTFVASTCFDLTTSIATTVENVASISKLQVKPFTETDERKIQAILNTIVSTFQIPSYPQQALSTELVAAPVTATSTPISTIGWKTYTNATYGLSIPYPPTLQVETMNETSNDGNYGLFAPCDPFDNTRVEPAVLLACFHLHPGTTRTDFIGASLAVIIPNLSQQHCIFMQNDFMPVHQTSLNGISFYFVDRTGAAAGLGGHFINYRTYSQNTCLEFDITIASDSYSENGGATLSTPVLPFSEDSIRAMFDYMISNFYLTPSQSSIRTVLPVSTANWTTYTNSAYGVSVAYPPATIQLLGGGNNAGKNFGPVPLCNSEYLNANYFQGVNPKLINCFYLPANTYPDSTNTGFIDASLAISVFNLNLYDCVTFRDIEFQQFYQFPVNGRIFTSFETHREDELHRRFDVHNRTFVHNTCFDLTTTLVVDADFEQTARFTESHRRHIQAIFDQMISTLNFSSPSQPATVNPADSFPQASTAGWPTYIDSTYPFSIAFPATMNVYYGYYGENGISLPNIPFRCNIHASSRPDPVVCFDFPKNTYSETTNTDFETASLQIGIYHADQQACMSFADTYLEGSPPWIKTGVINGITYSAVDNDESDTDRLTKVVRYRTFARNVCFDITTSININLYALHQTAPALRPLTDVEQHTIQGILNQMVIMFRVLD